jgi:hypothetical protein
VVAFALAVAGITCGLLLAAPAQAQFYQQGPKLVAADAVGTAFQGVSVSVSGDGNTAIAGGPGDNFSGAAWVYTRSTPGPHITLNGPLLYS